MVFLVVFKHGDFTSNNSINTMATDFMREFQVAAKVTAAKVAAVVGFAFLLFTIVFGTLTKKGEFL